VVAADACVLVDLVELHEDGRILVVETFLWLEVPLVELVEPD
jgi:hypothetical protein